MRNARSLGIGMPPFHTKGKVVEQRPRNQHMASVQGRLQAKRIELPEITASSGDGVR